MNHMSDIVGELDDWLGRMSTDVHLGKRSRQTPDFEIELVRRAIAEINGLREKLELRRGTRSIAAEDLERQQRRVSPDWQAEAAPAQSIALRRGCEKYARARRRAPFPRRGVVLT